MKVIFEINKQLDKNMALQFLNHIAGGVDFGRNIWTNHPQLKNLTKQNEKEIFAYIDTFYEKNINKLNEKIALFQAQWNEVEKDF